MIDWKQEEYLLSKLLFADDTALFIDSAEQLQCQVRVVRRTWRKQDCCSGKKRVRVSGGSRDALCSRRCCESVHLIGQFFQLRWSSTREFGMEVE